MKIKINHNRQHLLRDRKTLKALTYALHTHYAGITRLYAFASGKRTLKGKGYTDNAEQYQPTWEDQQRLLWSLQQLKQQIAPLEEALNLLLRNHH